MDILLTEHGWKDFCFWVDHDPGKVVKIKEIIRAIRTNPFKGIGKPEPLKHHLRGYWSRRIDHEHRLVYKVEGSVRSNQRCIIVQCRFHY